MSTPKDELVEALTEILVLASTFKFDDPLYTKITNNFFRLAAKCKERIEQDAERIAELEDHQQSDGMAALAVLDKKQKEIESLTAQLEQYRSAFDLLDANSYDHHTPHYMVVPHDKWKEAMALRTEI